MIKFNYSYQFKLLGQMVILHGIKAQSLFFQSLFYFFIFIFFKKGYIMFMSEQKNTIEKALTNEA